MEQCPQCRHELETIKGAVRKLCSFCGWVDTLPQAGSLKMHSVNPAQQPVDAPNAVGYQTHSPAKLRTILLLFPIQVMAGAVLAVTIGWLLYIAATNPRYLITTGPERDVTTRPRTVVMDLNLVIFSLIVLGLPLYILARSFARFAVSQDKLSLADAFECFVESVSSLRDQFASLFKRMAAFVQPSAEAYTPPKKEAPGAYVSIKQYRFWFNLYLAVGLVGFFVCCFLLKTNPFRYLMPFFW